MSRLLRVLAVSVISLTFFNQSLSLAAPASARSEAEKGIDSILSVLKDKNLAPDERREKLRIIVEDFVDFDTLSRLSIGPVWKEWTDAQRDEFITEFRQHMVGICTKFTRGYDDEEVIILGDKAEAKGDWTINTRILKKPANGAQEEVAKVDFRMRQKDDRWKVIDFNIAGISMAATFRAQFLVIMKDGGIDKLLKIMRDKNAAGEKATRTADADK